MTGKKAAARNQRDADRARERARQRRFPVVPDREPAGLRLALSRAQLAGNVPGQIAALKAMRAWWESWRAKPISKEDRIRVLDAIRALNDEIASLELSLAPAASEAADAAALPGPDQTADLRAQLDQANARTAAANRASQLAGAFVGALGFTASGQETAGGVTINVAPGVLPPSPQWLSELAGYTAEAVGGQGFRPASTVTLGV